VSDSEVPTDDNHYAWNFTLYYDDGSESSPQVLADPTPVPQRTPQEYADWRRDQELTHHMNDPQILVHVVVRVFAEPVEGGDEPVATSEWRRLVWGDADLAAGIDRRLPLRKFAALVRDRQAGELPPCPACGLAPMEIDLEGPAGQPVLRFQSCGHTIAAKA
jgi:hypothetical protein